MFEKLLAAITALTEAINANTAAKGGAAAAAPKPAAAAPKPSAAAPKPSAYTPVHTKGEAQAMATQVKELIGVEAARSLVKSVGYEKMADITKPVDLDKLYDEAYKLLVEGGHITPEGEGGAGDDDGI